MTEKTTKEEKQLNVYQKLQKVRVEVQKLNIKKSGKNAYANFSYFELKDFIPPVNELFDKYGLSSNFSIKENCALLYITDTDKLDDFVLFESPIADAQLKGCTPIQSLGAVHTYMKRYLYLNALELTEDDLLDKEAGNIQTNNNKQGTNPKFVLYNKLKEAKLPKEQMNAFCNHYGIDCQNESSIQEFLRKGNIENYVNEYMGVVNAG